MFVAPPVSYPGVYVQEVASDVRTIVGVDTATTAFLGRARRGPVDTAVVINSYADFERIFGGQWLKSSLGYAVNDFFLNGGSKAVVVRVFKTATGTGQAQIDANGLTLVAKYPGSWGNELAARITYIATAADFVDPDGEGVLFSVSENFVSELDASQLSAALRAQFTAKDMTLTSEAKLTVKTATSNWVVLDPDKGGNTKLDKEYSIRKNGVILNVYLKGPNKKAKVAQSVADRYPPDVTPSDLFALIVRDLKSGAIETFENVTTNTGPRQIKDVLAQGSELVKVMTDPTARPTPHQVAPSAGFNSVWDDPATRTKATLDSGSDGSDLDDVLGNQAAKTGLYALENADIFNLLCIPPFKGSDVSATEDVTGDVWAAAAAYCLKRRAMLLVDPPKGWNKEKAREGVPLPGIGTHTNAAIYFPPIKKPNLLRDNQIEEFVPCGSVAGIMARTDAVRGVWKAPAGLEATLSGVFDLKIALTDAENGELNPLGINCLRKLPAAGNVVWGSRTLAGDDRLASQWKYIPVRRTALFIEETIYRNIQWAVFEPNDEPLWAQLRLNIGVFMHDLFRQGAFQGQSPKDAYLVRCDATTTTQADIDKGIVNVVVGFAPLKPAEFVVIYIQQISGQLAV